MLATPKCPIKPPLWESLTNKSRKEQLDKHNLFSRNKKPSCLKKLLAAFFSQFRNSSRKSWSKGYNYLTRSRPSNFASRGDIITHFRESSSATIIFLTMFVSDDIWNISMNSTHRACLLFNLCWPFKCFKYSRSV